VCEGVGFGRRGRSGGVEWAGGGRVSWVIVRVSYH
jgi:hypothetical protein